MVSSVLERFLDRHDVGIVVAAAAAGADLLALEAAHKRGIRTRIVLPFAVERFRKTSVDAVSPDWSALYSEVIAEAERRDDLVIMRSEGSAVTAYSATNQRIVDEALAFASAHAAVFVGVAIWNGTPRVPGYDGTYDFVARVRAAGGALEEIIADLD